MGFIYYNANPLKNHVLDCTIRAISLAENKTYKKTFRELSEFALKRGLMMDSVESIEKFLNSKYRKKNFYRKITIGDFAKLNPRGTFLVTMKNHISTIINSNIVDTWDCSKKELKSVWKVSN